MKTIPVRELRNNHTGVLREVEGGETFTVTSNGRPVASLVPYTAPVPVGPRDGVPVAELARLLTRPVMTPEERLAYRADLDEADWTFTSRFVGTSPSEDEAR